MMKESLLHKLYFGKIKPYERKRICDPEYAARGQKIMEITEHFQNLLPPEEYEKFEEMQDLQLQNDLTEVAVLFEYSFCLGARMMIDIYSVSEETADRTEKRN